MSVLGRNRPEADILNQIPLFQAWLLVSQLDAIRCSDHAQRGLKASWRFRKSSAHTANALISADNISGVGSGRFSAGAALCSSSEHRPKPSRMD